jgi:hypothetical protein
MPSTVDFLSGAIACQLRAALQQAPLVQPVKLADHVPATFEGYTPTDLTIVNQTAIVPGWGYLQAFASFAFLGDGPSVAVSSMWIFAVYLRVIYLVHVLDLTSTPAATMRQGQNKIDFTVVAHQIPGV